MRRFGGSLVLALIAIIAALGVMPGGGGVAHAADCSYVQWTAGQDVYGNPIRYQETGVKNAVCWQIHVDSGEVALVGGYLLIQQEDIDPNANPPFKIHDPYRLFPGPQDIKIVVYDGSAMILAPDKEGRLVVHDQLCKELSYGISRFKTSSANDTIGPIQLGYANDAFSKSGCGQAPVSLPTTPNVQSQSAPANASFTSTSASPGIVIGAGVDPNAARIAAVNAAPVTPPPAQQAQQSAPLPTWSPPPAAANPAPNPPPAASPPAPGPQAPAASAASDGPCDTNLRQITGQNVWHDFGYVVDACANGTKIWLNGTQITNGVACTVEHFTGVLAVENGVFNPKWAEAGGALCSTGGTSAPVASAQASATPPSAPYQAPAVVQTLTPPAPPTAPLIQTVNGKDRRDLSHCGDPCPFGALESVAGNFVMGNLEYSGCWYPSAPNGGYITWADGGGVINPWTTEKASKVCTQADARPLQLNEPAPISVDPNCHMDYNVWCPVVASGIQTWASYTKPKPWGEVGYVFNITCNQWYTGIPCPYWAGWPGSGPKT